MAAVCRRAAPRGLKLKLESVFDSVEAVIVDYGFGFSQKMIGRGRAENLTLISSAECATIRSRVGSARPAASCDVPS